MVLDAERTLAKGFSVNGNFDKIWFLKLVFGGAGQFMALLLFMDLPTINV